MLSNFDALALEVLMRIYREKSTMDLYALEKGQLSAIVNLEGARFYLLGALIRYQHRHGGPIEKHYGGTYELFNEHFAHLLVVSKEELETRFERLENLRAHQNTDIHELKRTYERECVSFDDDVIIQTAEHVLRVSENTSDSKNRCDTHQLADFVLRHHGPVR